MTEDEAKTKWCPFTRMAWRWVDEQQREIKHEQGSLPDGFWVKRTFGNAPSGYCGLAGVPWR